MRRCNLLARELRRTSHALSHTLVRVIANFLPTGNQLPAPHYTIITECPNHCGKSWSSIRFDCIRKFRRPRWPHHRTHAVFRSPGFQSRAYKVESSLPMIQPPSTPAACTPSHHFISTIIEFIFSKLGTDRVRCFLFTGLRHQADRTDLSGRIVIGKWYLFFPFLFQRFSYCYIVS